MGITVINPGFPVGLPVSEAIIVKRPFLGLRNPDNQDFARFGQVGPTGSDGRADMLANLSFDGTNFNLDDTAKSGMMLSEAAGTLLLFYTAAGSNPRTLTQIFEIDNTGQLVIAGQIRFPATQSASSNANTLDDYEEGIFTPTLLFGGGNTGMTTAVASGFYVKIGCLVWAQIRIILTNKGSSTGAATITGFPFSEFTNLAPVAGEMYFTGFNAIVAPTFYLSGTTATLIRGGGTTIANMADTDFTNTSDFSGSIVYRTAT